ncbi:uncharacterized protein A4U43_C04F7510 [Asparagus officinalis]|uniref:U-box domain-containing protein n=1 Tax=Asparagus officinalis TaxID=4686 RepID=A0A5P1EZN3_ASPOF|nr:uncharacterized protein A4U43_C04F7510 [Asparagus officinalis]
MMKVGREGREAAVGVLWSVCFGSSGDLKAKEAVAAVAGGMAKILVVMQGDCSPAVRRMAGDLLRVFRVDKKSLVAGNINQKEQFVSLNFKKLTGRITNEVRTEIPLPEVVTSGLGFVNDEGLPMG